MRIPIYRSRAAATSEAPGRAINARMRGDVFAKAELQKASVGQELVSAVGEYAKVRFQAAQEAQYNEAALAIEEGMREAERTLSNTTDIYNVLDGKNLWEQNMKELRNATVSSVQNRTLQRKIGFAFDQSEIAARFKLRGDIDRKILAREQAAIARRMEQVENELSSVTGPVTAKRIEEYDQKLGSVVSSQSSGVASGRLGVDAVKKANKQLRVNIARKYVTNMYGQDPNAAMDLYNILMLQDEVARGEKTQEEAKQLANFSDAYGLHVLNNIDREAAFKIIQENLSASLKFFDAQEKLETEEQEETNQRNTKAYNFVMSVQDTAYVEPETLRQLMGDAKFLSLPQITQEGGVTGIFAKQLLRDHLNAQFWATPEQQSKMDEELDRTTEFKFAPAGEGSSSRYSELYAKAEAGLLTVEELNTDTRLITAQQHRELTQKVFNEASEALGVGSRILKRAFKYNELQAIGENDNLAQASKSAYEGADLALIIEFETRQGAGNPMTRPEIVAFAQAKVEEFGVIYREELREEFLNYIEAIPGQLGAAGFSLDPADPIGSLDRWFAQQEETVQNQQRQKYFNLKRVINARFGNQGIF